MSEAPGERLVVVNMANLSRVMDALRWASASDRPALARRLLLVALDNLCPETGAVVLSSTELGERLQSDHSAVSRAVSVLVELGAMRRERLPRPGLRAGFLPVRYFANPGLAWAGDPAARARWREGFSPLGERRHRSPVE